MAMLKGKLLRTFFVIILALSLTSVLVFVSHFTVVEKYKAISDNMIAEYKLMSTVSDLIASYNDRFRTSGLSDKQDADKKIETTKHDLEEVMTFLDTHILNPESQASYLGLKNTIADVVSEIDEGLKDLANDDVEKASVHYENANKKYLFVKESGNKLIFHELSYINSIQNNIQDIYWANSIIGGSMLFLAIGGSIVYAFRFSNKVALPLRKLTKTAEEVAAGDMQLTLSKELLERSDEIGRLARSYRTMLGKLLQNISELDTSNKNLKEVSAAITAKNAELEKLNEYMVNRELKMIELKKEIKACQSDIHKKENPSPA